MSYSIEPSYVLADGVCKELVNASTKNTNKWYFTGAGFNASAIDRSGDFSAAENFVIITDKKIIAYVEARWLKNLKVLVDFKVILFNESKKISFAKALFSYFEYIFISRGCDVITFDIAEKNNHLTKICSKLSSKYFGHECGTKTRNIRSIDGEVSDALLYEITREEYFAWKNKLTA